MFGFSVALGLWGDHVRLAVLTQQGQHAKTPAHLPQSWLPGTRAFILPGILILFCALIILLSVAISLPDLLDC